MKEIEATVCRPFLDNCIIIKISWELETLF